MISAAVISTCIVVSAIVWIPVSFAARVIGGILQCSPTENGALTRYACAGKSAAINLILPIAIALILFLVRKRLASSAARCLQRVPLQLRPLVGPALATLLFAAFWAWNHYSTPFMMGILPQIVFPAAIGTFTYVSKRQNQQTRQRSAPLSWFNDRIPKTMRIVLIAAATISLSWAFGLQRLITGVPLQQQILVLVGLALSYVALSPRQSAAPIAVAPETRS